MATVFQLRARESVTHGLRRIASKQARSAQTLLRKTSPPTDEAVHEARKSVKKLRAIVDLIEADRQKTMRDVEERLHRVGHLLSQVRDAAVMLETLAALHRRYPQLVRRPAFRRARRRLSSQKQTAIRHAASDAAWKEASRHLSSLAKDAKMWRPAHRGFRALSGGLRVTHRRGHKAMQRALKRGKATDFHDWRKAIKALWYELRLVERSGQRIRRDVRDLHRAETWLGEDHNVVVLCETLSGDPSIWQSDIERDRFRLAADKYQAALRKKAIACVRPLYGRRRADYLRRVRSAWKAWRHPR